MSTLLVIVLILVVLAVAPVGPIAGWHTYGWGPSGGILGTVLLIVLILFLLGRF